MESAGIWNTKVCVAIQFTLPLPAERIQFRYVLCVWIWGSLGRLELE